MPPIEAMLRVLLTAALLAAVGLVGTILVARAYDHEAIQRVLLTRDGVTLVCDRVVSPTGQVDLENCDRVP